TDSSQRVWGLAPMSCGGSGHGSGIACVTRRRRQNRSAVRDTDHRRIRLALVKGVTPMHIHHARRTTMDRRRSCLARATALAAISATALLAAAPASASPSAAFTSTAANIHRFVGIQTQVGHTFTATELNAIGAQ